MGQPVHQGARGQAIDQQGAVGKGFFTVVNIDGKAVVSSLAVAEAFEKDHKDVLKAMRNLGVSEDFGQRNFAPSNYLNKQGKEQPMFHMTRDGFAMLAMGFNGDKAMKWKEAYINQFNKMEEALRKQDRSWLQARIDGKVARSNLTDCIRDVLIPHAIGQGSKNYGKLYEVYTKMVNDTLIDKNGVELKKRESIREYLPSFYLVTLAHLEDKMAERIRAEVSIGTPYKEIFQSIKTYCKYVATILGSFQANLPRHRHLIALEGGSREP
jgi:Rha family phage regulatory protein